MPMKKIFVAMPESLEEKLNKLVENYSALNQSDMLRRCVDIVYKKTYPNYVELEQERMKIRKDPTIKAKTRVDTAVAIEDRKKEIHIDKCRAIANELQGEPIDKEGVPHIRYKQWQQISKDVVDFSYITVALEDLKDTDVYYQYTDLMGDRGPEVKEKLLAMIQNNELQSRN